MLHRELCHVRLDLLICDPLKAKEDKIIISYVPCRQSIRFVVAYLNTAFSRTVMVQRARKLSILISGNHYISVKPHVRIGQEVFLKSSPEASVLALFG